jgi:uncharacterized membrane protein
VKMRTIHNMINDLQPKASREQGVAHPFRRAVLRGLAVLCPPLLTVLILAWAVNTTKSYFLEPVTRWARESIVWCVADIRYDLPLQSPTAKTAKVGEGVYRQLDNGTFIPEPVYDVVQRQPGPTPPSSGEEYYNRYVDLTYLRPYLAIPFFLSLFILLLYFLGKFMAVGLGRFFWDSFDRMISRLPGVRSVYSSIKQVSDFFLSEHTLKFSRIVAVEFPSKGIWSIGFVTNESFEAVKEAAQEPVLVVLLPYSPIPHTGCTVVVGKSKCIDLGITFDQACQFIISCGVVTPPHELSRAETAEDK